MAYNKTNWENLPSTNTPIYDANLNKIENKLSDLDTNKNIYSVNETRIGTWIDGKPLYRKTLVFPNGNNGVLTPVGYNLSDYGIYNVDNIYISNPSYYTNDNGIIKIPFNFYDGNRFEASVRENLLAVTLSYEHISRCPFVITLEYTKTTD